MIKTFITAKINHYYMPHFKSNPIIKSGFRLFFQEGQFHNKLVVFFCYLNLFFGQKLIATADIGQADTGRLSIQGCFFLKVVGNNQEAWF